MRQRMLALLAANGDLFGFDPAVLDDLDSSTANFLLVDQIGGATRGEIQVRPSGTGSVTIDVTPWIAVTPKLTEADVGKKLVGARYKETIGYGRVGGRDCAMQPGGARNCIGRAKHWKTQRIVVDADAVRSIAWFHHEGRAIRLVACADIRPPDDPPIDDTWRDLSPDDGAVSHAFAPIGAPPIPLVIDLVTGQQLPTSAASCDDPSITQDR